MFQFQTGAIKRLKLHHSLEAMRCFNSKLVRLKVAVGPITSKASVSTFQFQTGAIKSVVGCSLSHSPRLFQFQTGAIKRDEQGQTGGAIEARFQFQTGAIKRKTVNNDKVQNFAMFQFQTGAIRSNSKQYILACNAHVSIPNWCD